MKKILGLTIICTTLFYNLFSIDLWAQSFLDIPANHWAFNDIEAAYNANILIGASFDQDTNKRLFKPDDILTRVQLVTVINRAFYANEFTEISNWAERAIKLANHHNLFHQLSFPSEYQKNLTRYDVAIIVANVLKDYGFKAPTAEQKIGIQKEILDYHDFAKTPAEESVLMVYNLGILTGKNQKGLFSGNALFTRAEVAAIYNRINIILTNKTAAQTQENYIHEVVRLVNIERTKENIPPVQENDILNQCAQIRANELLELFSHTRPNGQSPFSIIDEANYTYYYAAENIGSGYLTPAHVVKGWMNSEGHRKNIMNKSFTRIGVGHVNNEWVQLFTD